MTALVALWIATVVLSLVLLGSGAWLLIAWRQYRRTFDILAERLSVDARLEQLTTQTLSAIREAARSRGGGLTHDNSKKQLSLVDKPVLVGQ